MFDFFIGDNKISIKDRFTLILGKFKKNKIALIQKDDLFDALDDFNSISMENFISIFTNGGKNYLNLDKSLNLLEFLREYRKTTILNTELMIEYINLIQSLILILDYNLFLNKKSQLLKELELSKIKLRSSEIAAKSDLFNKLNESYSKNKRKLKYFEEDFFNLKNQRDQIKNTVKDFNLQIQELNKQKKECFSQINRITREMSDPSHKNEKNLNNAINFVKNQSKSERIKSLQKKARETQYQIKQINLKINESQLKLNEITPNYDRLKKDYYSLLEVIKNDETRLKNIRVELENTLIESENETLRDIDFTKLESIKPSQEIENEIQKIESKINIIKESNKHLDIENPSNLSKILKKLKEIDGKLVSNKDDLIITYEKDEVIKCIENFRKIENIINDLEMILNTFLYEINIKAHFKIIINEEYKNFFIKTEFIRFNKESLNFEELTTPEKIFFVILFYISFKIHSESKHIIFSNLLFPSKYNRRGSVFRTIRKILPVFEKNDNLKKYILVFIISNLEMKKPIENINVIKIEQDE